MGPNATVESDHADPDRISSTQSHALAIGAVNATFRSLPRCKGEVPAGLAEFERDLILQRTNEGRARALADGTRFGRKPKMTKHQQRKALKRVAAGEPMREIALSYNVDHRRSVGSRHGTLPRPDRAMTRAWKFRPQAGSEPSTLCCIASCD